MTYQFTAKWRRYTKAFILSSSLISLPLHAELTPGLSQIIQAQPIPESGIGLWIQQVNSPTPIVSHQPRRLFNPASTIKLATTLAALLELGPDFTWTTHIRSTAPVIQGVLKGDLIIHGTGDPGQTSEEHWRMLGDLQRVTGLRRIEGNVILDASYFAPPTDHPGDFDNEPFRAYNQLAYPLHVNSNAIRFHFFPEAGRVRIASEPSLPGLRILNQLKAARGDCNTYQRGIAMRVRDNEITFSGAYPSNCGVYDLLRSVTPPDFTAREQFRLHWRQWGGEVTGQVLSHQGTALPYTHTLMEHMSRPLADLIRVINKWSHNIMTRHLALTVGIKRFGTPGSPEKGRVALQQILAEQGVNTSGLLIDNGSGLSRSTRISPEQLAQILRIGWMSPRRHEFVASMSIAGIDGTTRRHYRNDPKTGMMHLKTGHLNEVSAVAGYVRNRCDDDVMLVLLMNHPQAHLGHGTRLQQRITEWVYQHSGSC